MTVVDQYRMDGTGAVDVKQIARALRAEEEKAGKWKMVSGILCVSLVGCFLLCLAASALAFHVMKDTELATQEVGVAETAGSRRRLQADGASSEETFKFTSFVDRDGNKVHCSIDPESMPEKEPEMEDVYDLSQQDFCDPETWLGARLVYGEGEDTPTKTCVVADRSSGAWDSWADNGSTCTSEQLPCTNGDTIALEWSVLQARRLELEVADWAEPDDVRRRSSPTFADWADTESKDYKTMTLAKIKFVCMNQWGKRTNAMYGWRTCKPGSARRDAAGQCYVPVGTRWSAAGERAYHRCVQEITSRRMKGKPLLLMRDAIIGMHC